MTTDMADTMAVHPQRSPAGENVAEQAEMWSDDSSDHAAEISESMFAVMRAHNSLRARVTGGADAEIGALFLLVKLIKDGPRRAGELAEMICADPSTVSRQVAALVKFGLVERKADPDDGRASILVPTEKGEAKVQEFTESRGRSIAPVVSDWPVEDRLEFIRLLRSYSEGLDRHRDEILAGLTGLTHHLHPFAVTPLERSQA